MRRLPTSGVRLAVGAVAITGLVVTGMPGAQAAPHRAAAATPSLTGTVENHHLTLKGDTSFGAGRLDLTLKAVDHESTIAVFNLHPGYTFHDARDDIRTFGQSFSKNGPSKKGLKALNHAINHITGYGGLDVAKGKTGHATLLIPQSSGTTVVFNDTGNLPREKTVLTVGAPAGPQSLPAADAKVVAKTNKRFGGDRVLPANGVVRLRNVSTESPHFMFMTHVKEGTTRKQVIEGLQSNGDPGFFLRGFIGGDVLTTGQAQNLSTNLHAGEYALMCFFPDPKTGMPHAYMGMVKIVHLK